jgi:hypothetical protein
MCLKKIIKRSFIYTYYYSSSILVIRYFISKNVSRVRFMYLCILTYEDLILLFIVLYKCMCIRLNIIVNLP